MALPLIPLLKLFFLGALKIVFLLVGTVFFPVYALRLILTGASGMLLPALDWMEQEGRLDSERHRMIVDDLQTLAAIAFTRSEARAVLLSLIRQSMQKLRLNLQTGWLRLRSWLDPSG